MKCLSQHFDLYKSLPFDWVDIVPLAAESQQDSDAETLPSAESNASLCRLCGASGSSREEQVAHFRSSWHAANLRRRLGGKAALDEASFDDLSDEEEEDEREGEDESQPAAAARSSSTFHFLDGRNDVVYSVHSVLAPPCENPLGRIARLRSRLSSPATSVILLLAGGRFAGATFVGASVSQHKTFARYTVRAGQGGQQSAADGASATKQPKSAGATLRRYNQEALAKEVGELLRSWAPVLAKAEEIFVRFSTYHRPILFNDPSPLAKDDKRIRNIPLITRRPTLAEIKRIHSRLFSVSCHGDRAKFEEEERIEAEAAAKRRPQAPQAAKARTEYDYSLLEDSDPDEKKDEPTKGTAHRKAPEVELVEEAPSLISKGQSAQLYTICKTGCVSSIESFFKEMAFDELTQVHVLNSPPVKDAGSYLHFAASQGHMDLVMWMLDKGASPLLRNGAGQVAFQVAAGRSLRAAMSRFREAKGTLWDWDAAQIPPSLSDEAEAKAAAKLAEKRRKDRARKKEKAAEEKAAAAAEAERLRFLNLSDREKRAMAAEARLGLVHRCFGCGVAMGPDQVPFEYSNYRFCSTACVRRHREAAAAT